MRTSSNAIYLLAKKHIVKRKQFILYALIGVSGVTIDYIAYILGVGVLGMGILLANFVSISLGIINNFFLNIKYNFKVRDRLWTRFGLFYGVGFLGLLLSEVLLVIFHYGFHMGPLVAKLATLPIILVFQYALNKYLSFGSVDESAAMMRKLFFHWPGYVVILIFFITTVGFMRNIPADFSRSTPAYAPDEITHYIFNVEFILKYKSLPVSGKDDIDAYTNCRDNENGKVSCLYSYAFYPGASYLVNAASAGIVPKISNVTPQMAARIPSVVYGLIFAISAYITAYIICRRRLFATLLAAGVTLIPQVMFTTAYTNLDAHSLGISGLLGVALAYFLVNPQKRWAIPALAIVCGGLLPLAKYNFFVLALPVIAFVIYYFATKVITKRQLLLWFAWAIGAFIIFASFWYVRNLVLYQDPFGQTFAIQEMSKYHELGQSHSPSFSSIVYLNDLNFFHILFRSFYVAYGGMFYFLEDAKYQIPGVILIGMIIGLISYLVSEGRRLRVLLYATLAYLGLFLLVLGQVILNSLEYDFQPQGRYLFPILIPTVFLLAYCVRIDRRLGALSVLLATGTIYMFICGLDLMMKVYL
jgi:putative flippase GtrA